MKHSPFKTIKVSIMVWFSALVLITLMIFYSISLRYTEETVLENSIDYTSKLVNQVNSDIDYYISYMKNISSVVTGNADIRKFLQGTEEASGSQDSILTQFGTVIDTRADIANIAVIAKDGRAIINRGEDVLNPYIDLKQVDWIWSAMSGGEAVLSSSHVQYVINDNYKWVVTLCRPIYIKDAKEPDGVFFIDLNYKLLRDLCENNSLASDSYVFILDEAGNIIYHPKQQLLFRGLTTEKVKEVMDSSEDYFILGEGRERKLYTKSKSDQTGWSVVGVVSISSLMPKQGETQNIYLLTAVLLILAGILLAVLLVSAVTRPIQVLRSSMRKVEEGNFEEAKIREIPQNEIGLLSNSFNIMLDRIHQLMEENVNEQKQKRRSELRALRSQIKPHFLYNTLDSIIWMAESGKKDEVVMMTSSLAKLLRQSISNEEEMIPLRNEIEYARSYLIIQKMRYKDKLEFRIDVEKQILDERIVNLVLQPIVENAIYHGIKNKEGKGMIEITGRAEGDDIVLCVTDNGAGMDDYTRTHIFDMSRQREKEKGSGVGIYNVQLRIRLYYGDEYGLSFESREGEGTRVTIRMARYNEQEKKVFGQD